MDTIAGGIAALFESARLSENLEQSRKEMSVADQIARITTTTLDIESGYDEFFPEVKKLVDFDEAGVVMINDGGSNITPVYFTDPEKIPFAVGQAYKMYGTLLDKIIEERKSITVQDLGEKGAFWAGEQLVRAEILSLAMTPLIFEDKIIGGFVFYSRQKNAFGEREMVILDRLASQVVPSVGNSLLYQEADQYALALDSIGESVTFLDLELKIRYVNRAFEDTFGYRAHEILGKEIWILIDNDSAKKAQTLDIINQSFTDGWSGEVISKTKSGETFDTLLTVAPVRDKNGNVIGRIGVSRDITERKRTAARLTEQSRLASIGELAAGVAHEMNNPLTSILLCSQMLTESDLPADTLEDLTIISKAARHAAKIVQSLLLFARREDPQPEPMTLDSVVNQALELKRHDFRSNNISTHTNFEAGLPYSLVDSHQMS